jgi:hypothetical protein
MPPRRQCGNAGRSRRQCVSCRRAATRRRVVAAFVVINAAVLVALLEVAPASGPLIASGASSRPRPATDRLPAAPAQVEAAGRALGLDVYEMADPLRPGRWRLRPASVARSTRSSRRSGPRAAFWPCATWSRRPGRSGIEQDAIAIEVNAEGFRGPALDQVAPQCASSPWGTPAPSAPPWRSATHTRAPWAELRAQGGESRSSTPESGLRPDGRARAARRVPRAAAEITTLHRLECALRSATWRGCAWGVPLSAQRSAPVEGEHAAQELGRRSQEGRARAAYERPKRPDRAAPELRILEEYRPSFYPQLERIVERCGRSAAES